MAHCARRTACGSVLPPVRKKNSQGPVEPPSGYGMADRSISPESLTAGSAWRMNSITSPGFSTVQSRTGPSALLDEINREFAAIE